MTQVRPAAWTESQLAAKPFIPSMKTTGTIFTPTTTSLTEDQNSAAFPPIRFDAA